MRVIKRITLLILLLFTLSCEYKSTDGSNSTGGSKYDGYKHDINCPSSLRVGALCKDGTTSTAIGRGACSYHGGVNYWYCNN